MNWTQFSTIYVLPYMFRAIFGFVRPFTNYNKKYFMIADEIYKMVFLKIKKKLKKS
jgi:hypothetical protein